LVAVRIAAPAQVLEDPDERPLLTGRLGLVPRQQRLERGRPPAQLRARLDVPVVRERRRPRPHHLADRIPRHAEIPSDLLDRLALEKIFTPNPANRLHRQHPPLPASDPTRAAHHASWQGGQLWTPIPPIRGSRLHAETHQDDQHRPPQPDATEPADPAATTWTGRDALEQFDKLRSVFDAAAYT